MKKFIIFLAVLIFAQTSVSSCFGENVSNSDAHTTSEEAIIDTASEDNIPDGTWSVGGVIHDGRVYDVHDVDGLEDLYDTVFLWFGEDDDFGYINLYQHNGSCIPFREKSYLLKTQSTYKYGIEDDKIVREEITSDQHTTYLAEFVDDMYTLRFGQLDPITGKIKTGDSPLLFVKNGNESDYIAKNKVSVSNNGGASESNSNTNRPATMGERNAAKMAKEYLEIIPFSYTGLVEQLEFEGFTPQEAIYGADHCEANWNTQAAKKASDYLEIFSFSRSELIAQLEFDGYSYEQAVYGVEQNGY